MGLPGMSGYPGSHPYMSASAMDAHAHSAFSAAAAASVSAAQSSSAVSAASASDTAIGASSSVGGSSSGGGGSSSSSSAAQLYSASAYAAASQQTSAAAAAAVGGMNPPYGSSGLLGSQVRAKKGISYVVQSRSNIFHINSFSDFPLEQQHPFFSRFVGQSGHEQRQQLLLQQQLQHRSNFGHNSCF